MLAEQFITSENQTIIWNVLSSQIEAFNRLPTDQYRISIFQKFIGQTYDDLSRKQIPYSLNALQEANRYTLRQIVSELKPTVSLPTLPPKKTQAAAANTISDMYEMRKNEYVAANAKPVLPENPFELPKDEPITNMDELIEQHKNSSASSTFSAFDAARMTSNPLLMHQTAQEQTQVIVDIQRQLGELREEIAQLKKIVNK